MHNLNLLLRRKFFLLTCLICLLLFLSPSYAGTSQPLRPDEGVITDFLSTHQLITSTGSEILDVTIQGEALVIDLSKSFLPDGVYEKQIFTGLQTDLDLALQINLFYMTSFKVEGEPLEFWGRPAPDIEPIDEMPGIDQLPVSGPLSGVKIALSPGHGLYWNETYSEWHYQRI